MSVIVNGKIPDKENKITLTSSDISLTSLDSTTIQEKIETLQSSVQEVNQTLGIVVGNESYVTITQKVDNVYTTKISINNSIQNKGVNIPENTPFEKYSEYIDKIVTNGGEEPLPQQEQKYEVTFIDYDGTIISKQKVLQKQQVIIPTVSEKKNLIFQGWTNNLTQLNSDLCIGAIYQTLNNKCYFELQIQHNGDSANISFNVEETSNGKIIVDWGDSIVTEETINEVGIVRLTHTYVNRGIYQITFDFVGITGTFDKNCFSDFNNKWQIFPIANNFIEKMCKKMLQFY